jgi:hypothetical protein
VLRLEANIFSSTEYSDNHSVFDLPIKEYMKCHDGQTPEWAKNYWERGIKDKKIIMTNKTPGVAFTEREDFDTPNGLATVLRFNHIGFVRKSIEIFYPIRNGKYAFREETNYVKNIWKVTSNDQFSKEEVEEYINQWL